jgi:transcription elongation factor SPT4
LDDDEDDLGEEEDEEDAAHKRQRFAQIPNEVGATLSACIPCMLVKTFAQFKNHGCENCSDVIDLMDSDAVIMDVTTAGFEGMAALTRPADSWVARWQFAQKMLPGVYALKVDRDVSEEVATQLDQANFVNIGRMLLKEASKRKEN